MSTVVKYINPLIFLSLLLLSKPVIAQRASGVVIVFNVPSGTCAYNAPIERYGPSNAIYGCLLPAVSSLTGTWGLISGAGGGTVTSVGFTSNLGTIGGSPVTTSGTISQTVSAANVVGLFSVCSGAQYLGADGSCHTGSSGSVTSIATTFPITGGTITTTGTIACATCVTSASSLTSNLPMIGAGGQASAVGTRSGNTTEYVTTTGAQTSGNCVSIDANGNHIAAGVACSTANQQIRTIGYHFDGGGVALTGTSTYCLRVPYGGTLTGWYIDADQSGSGTFAIRSVAFGSYTGVAGFAGYTDVTGGGTAPILSSAVTATFANLTSWVTTVTAGDEYCFRLSSPATATWMDIYLQMTTN